jgi:periplasmic protein TonB
MIRRDLIVGVLVSVLIHGGLAVGGELAKRRPKKAAVKEETPTIELIKMPEIPPDEPDVVDTNEPAAEVSPIAPPSLVDVPGVVQVDSFVQQIQPPPPPSMGKPTGVITIPTGKIGAGGRGLGEIFDIKNLDQQPSVRFQAKPAYPFEMRRAGISGEVVIQFIVDTNGDVRDPFVVKSSQREFEAAAMQAVAKWKFRPGKKGGKAVNTRMVVPMVFSLNNDE